MRCVCGGGRCNGVEGVKSRGSGVCGGGGGSGVVKVRGKIERVRARVII